MPQELAVALDAPLGPPSAAVPRTRASVRRASIDSLRGFVIVLMALDHVRDYFSEANFSPTDLSKTTPALFFTRLITHLCAPTFVFLAGMSAHLMSQRMSRRELSRFLLTRGSWLVVLEFTVVNFVWTFNFEYRMGLVMQVIWVIGISMCMLAALVHLPVRVVGALAIATIAGHNLLDGIAPASFGTLAPLWNVLHVQGRTPFGLALYPVVPWFAVMAAGFAFGAPYTRAERPARLAATLGAVLLVGFVLVRGLNVYGDPAPWSEQTTRTFTLLSFLNVSKYPPSLAYLLLTLGAALLLLALFERSRAPGALALFGRVPLFAYVVHIGVAHLFAGLIAMSLGLGSGILTNTFVAYPESWGFGLPGVYAAWLAVLAAIYPACRWFARVKRTHDAWWLSYL